MISSFNRKQNGRWMRRMAAACAVLFSMLFVLPSVTKACKLSGGGDEGSWFQVTGHSFQGNYLIITYDIEYPGMTKVKLYNGQHELLWRSQYVNDKEGEHKLVLKASALNPGNYIFEFDYKNRIQNYPLSM